MNIQERIPLARLTTLGVGGSARFFVEAHTEKDIENAIVFAREHGLPLVPLGRGSNVLVPDAGIDGVVIKMALQNIIFENDGDSVLLVADAGVAWEDAVDVAIARGLFGIENLAGIPGTVGGAAVQNIGAYGAEFSSIFVYADVIDCVTGEMKRITHSEAVFSYRSSFFKERRGQVIVRVALRLSNQGTLNVAYADLARAHADGVPLATPKEISAAVRGIRAKKFPKNTDEGTAGSFFKNPVISRAQFASLEKNFPGIPGFAQENGEIKVSLAWILDHALSLKGFSNGAARLYENHPLVIVARAGTRASEVDALAHEVAARVFSATGIMIEREVETFGAHHSFEK